MLGKETYLTREGYEKLSEELRFLSTTRRRELSQEIGEAREKGDLRENAEYDAAKEAQGLNEKRVVELQDVLSQVKIIDDLNIPGDKIYLGAKMHLQNTDTEEEHHYMLVSGIEADIDQGKISIASPLGKGLLGKQEGDAVAIQVPAGLINYKILGISR